MKVNFIILLILIGCGNKNSITSENLPTYKKEKDKIIGNIELYQKNISYPYKATKDREQTILNNIDKLKIGLSKKEVLEMMTKPDEVNLTYKYIKVKVGKEAENIVGFSFVYLLRRDVEHGSIIEKNEQGIRIFFDKSEKVINIDDYSNITHTPNPF